MTEARAHVLDHGRSLSGRALFCGRRRITDIVVVIFVQVQYPSFAFYGSLFDHLFNRLTWIDHGNVRIKQLIEITSCTEHAGKNWDSKLTRRGSLVLRFETRILSGNGTPCTWKCERGALWCLQSDFEGREISLRHSAGVN